MVKDNYYKAFIILILAVTFSEYSFSVETKTTNDRSMVVIIDPGHGGKDPGAVSKGVREKDVVLAIGKKLGRYINESFPDVKVIFTRSTDVFVPLIDRSKIANKSKADLFISLHANICGTPSTRGTETFCLGVARLEENLDVAKKENSVIKLEDDYSVTYEGFDPDSDISNIMFEMAQETYLNQSLSFADAIQQQLKNNSESSNRGVKQAGFLVLRLSAMPSVLVETGFISNHAEANYLNSEEGQQKIAISIFEAFRKFKSKNSASSIQANVEKQSKSGNEKTSVNPKQKTEIKTAVAEDLAVNNTPEQPTTTLEKNSVEKTEPINHPENTSIVQAKKTPEQTEINNPNTKSQDSNLKDKEIEENSYYSVQIGANITPVEPIAANFKGLKEIRREKTDKYYRYYIGKETSIDKITPIFQQIKLKYPQAFIVSFVDGKRVIVDSSLKQ